jgi:hypothetical protein
MYARDRRHQGPRHPPRSYYARIDKSDGALYVASLGGMAYSWSDTCMLSAYLL